MSSLISKFAGYSLAALSAAVLFHAGRATAGEPTSGTQPISVQEAMQNVLTGNHRLQTAQGIRTADVNTMKWTAGVQEGMQEILLGPSTLRVGITAATLRSGDSRELVAASHRAQHSPADTQAAVQRMLRGDRARPEQPSARNRAVVARSKDRGLHLPAHAGARLPREVLTPVIRSSSRNADE
jgi:hypothetical protein